MIALSHSTSRSSTSGPSHCTLTETTDRISAVVTTAVSARAACSKASTAVLPNPRTPTSAPCGKCSHLGLQEVAARVSLIFAIYVFHSLITSHGGHTAGVFWSVLCAIVVGNFMVLVPVGRLIFIFLGGIFLVVVRAAVAPQPDSRIGRAADRSSESSAALFPSQSVLQSIIKVEAHAGDSDCFFCWLCARLCHWIWRPRTGVS